MRELNIGDQVIGVRATPLALLYYRQEFKSDLLADIVKLGAVSDDLSKLDTLAILQLIWAMAKANKFGKEFPPFEKWLGTLESMDISDPAFMVAAMEEASDGFFRSNGLRGAKK